MTHGTVEYLDRFCECLRRLMQIAPAINISADRL